MPVDAQRTAAVRAQRAANRANQKALKDARGQFATYHRETSAPQTRIVNGRTVQLGTKTTVTPTIRGGSVPSASKTVTRNVVAEQANLANSLKSNTQGGANIGIRNGSNINDLGSSTRQLIMDDVNQRTYGTARPVFTQEPAVSGTSGAAATPTETPTGGATSTGTTSTGATDTSGSINRPVIDSTAQTDTSGLGYYTTQPEQYKSLQDVRTDTLDRYQQMVNATEALYQNQLQNIIERGRRQQAEAGSMAVGAGIAGTPFAQSISSSVDQYTDQQRQQIAAQRSAEVAGYLDDAYNKADQLYQQGIENYRADQNIYISERDKLLQEQEKKREAVKKSAIESIGNMATGGYSIDELPKDQYQKLLQDSGMSDFEARAIWAAKTPEANASYSVENGFLVQQYFDPRTGKPVVKTTALPPELAAAATPDIQTITTGDGQVYWYDANDSKNADGTLKTFAIGGVKQSDGSWATSTTSAFGRTKDSKYITDAGKLADDYSANPIVKNFATQQDGYNYASQFDVNTTNPYEDQSLIFSLMKVLDPGSVVREGEYATAQRNTSLLDQMGVKLNQVLNGQALSPEQRQNILDALRVRYESSNAIYQGVVDTFATRAENYGIDPQDVITDYGVNWGGDTGSGTENGGVDLKSYVQSAIDAGYSAQDIYDDLVKNGDYTPPADMSIDPSAVVNNILNGTFTKDLSTSQNGSPLSIAKQYLGMNAGDPKQARTLSAFFKKAGGLNVDPSTTAWCAAFLNSVLGQAGIKGTGSLAAQSFLNFGKPVDRPTKGDIVVFERGNRGSGLGHVGIVVGINSNGTLQVLGGNQSNSASIETFKTDRVLGYRRIDQDTVRSTVPNINA